MYDTLYSAFAEALKREGKVMTTYTDNTPCDVLFRRNSDRNKATNTTTIFYPADSIVRPGQLLKYKNQVYLSINQETAENDVYLKSDLRQTNATMNFIADGTEHTIPVYANDVNGALVSSGSVISLLSGNVLLLAEDNALTRTLKLDDKFSSLGRWWKINNLIYKDNLIYIYIQVEAAPQVVYTVDITANDSYDRGTVAQFTAIAKANNQIITNATILWQSSDTSKATVDANGFVTFIGLGSVDITATWQEHNTTVSKSITVTKPAEYTLVIHAENTYTTNDFPTITATASIDGTPDTSATIDWISSDLSIATIDETGTITFLAAGTVTFTAIWVEHNVIATKTVEVTQASTDSYTMTITYSGKPEIKDSGSVKSFTVHTFINEVETNFDFEWELLNAQPAWIKSQERVDRVIKLQASDGGYIGEQFQLRVYNTEYHCEAIQTITIIPLF